MISLSVKPPTYAKVGINKVLVFTASSECPNPIPMNWCLLKLGESSNQILAKWSNSHYSWINTSLIPIDLFCMGEVNTVSYVETNITKLSEII